MVGLISSRKCLIQSLAIQSLPNERDLIDPTMWGLNMSILKNISLKDRDNGLAKNFLDLAAQSTQDQMTIELYQTQSTLLKHELLKYAIELSITGNFNDLSQRKVSLPRVRSLHLKGDQRTLDAFDLVNLESLHFWWMDYSPQQFSPHCLPTQLINLSLSRTELTSKQMSQKKAHYLPNLLTLRLSSMGIEGPLQHYFELPRLKHMEISEVKFRRLLKPNAGEEYDDEDEEYRGHNGEIYEEIDPVSWADMLFSSKVPTLETLILFSIPIFDGLVLELRTYPNLKRLSVGGIDVTSFFSSLIGCLADNVRYFPVLCRVDIKASWTSGTAMSYAGFVDYCASRRPHMDIYGAGLYES
ncbi:hypothetical protein CPB86DRAFT_212219 [Serendipita vermifera]|nr:hypothetical protein CPB86DRAFT_212219 [Serendipita vermifera]